MVIEKIFAIFITRNERNKLIMSDGCLPYVRLYGKILHRNPMFLCSLVGVNRASLEIFNKSANGGLCSGHTLIEDISY